MCPQRKKSRHVRSGDLVYKTVVETEDLVARITVAAGAIADMPGIFERTRESMVRRCTACIQGQWSHIRAVPVNATAVIKMLNYLRGQRLVGISGSLIWSKTLMEPMFNPCGEFR